MGKLIFALFPLAKEEEYLRNFPEGSQYMRGSLPLRITSDGRLLLDLEGSPEKDKGLSKRKGSCLTQKKSSSSERTSAGTLTERGTSEGVLLPGDASKEVRPLWRGEKKKKNRPISKRKNIHRRLKKSEGASPGGRKGPIREKKEPSISVGGGKRRGVSSGEGGGEEGSEARSQKAKAFRKTTPPTKGTKKASSVSEGKGKRRGSLSCPEALAGPKKALREEGEDRRGSDRAKSHCQKVNIVRISTSLGKEGSLPVLSFKKEKEIVFPC